MFSRALCRANPSTWAAAQGARQSTTVTTEAAKVPSWVDGPERDLVNFPRIKPPTHPAPVRMGFVPQNWFDMFYTKTGVTGPYMLGVGAITFLVSKEIYVLEHEFYGGVATFLLYGYGIKRFGPEVAEWAAGKVEENRKELDQLKDVDVETNTHGIASATAGIEAAENHATLFQAKRENVKLQLEAAYRQRLVQVHDEVKKRLDYQLETSNVKSRFEQKHMVEWIVQNVKSSITPASEKATLAQCLSDLKGLAARA